MRSATAIILFVLSSMGSMAQKTYSIPRVEIASSRLLRQSGTTRTMIDSTAIASTINKTFAELLSSHSPIFVKSYGGGSTATVSFRGTAASHTAVEWNGLSINNPMLGQVDFSMLPVWMIDHTELLHGGSSLTSGVGALGGAVVVGSTPQWDRPIYGSVMQSIGSFATYQTSLAVGGGSRKFQTRLRYVYDRSRNDFKYLNIAVPPFEYVKQENATYQKHAAVADLYLNLSRGHFLSANIWFHTADRELPTIMSYEGPGRNENQQDHELRAAAKWGFFNEKIKSKMIVGYSTTTLNYFLSNQTGMGQVVNFDSRSSAQSAQVKYSLDWKITKNTLLQTIVQGRYDQVRILDHITKEGYRANRMDAAITASIHHRFTDRVSIFGLLKYESTGEFMPSIGLQYEPVKRLILKINATRNYHQPTLNDLYWLPGGNPDLRSEKGYTADVGASFSVKDWLTIGATGYLSWIDDWIIWRPSEYRYWRATNIKKVFARGVELNFNLSHNFSGVGLSMQGNYTFTRTTNQEPDLLDDASQGRQLIYIPLHKANLMFEATYRGFRLNYGWGLVGERFTTSSGENTRHTLPLYDLHSITVGKTLRKFDLQFKIDNLWDKDYQSILWRAMPRRNYTFIARFTF